MKLLVILLLVEYCFYITLAEQSPKVKIIQGLLSGTSIVTRGGRQVSGFLGIPYAAPPTGQLRFKSPQPAPEWEGVRDASKEGNECYQQFVLIDSLRNITTGSEDCLYLNVFTPKLSQKKRLPVMFFIHGGSYAGGSGNSINYGPELLLDRDVVLVTINYRLGPLGFLSTGDSVLPGNLGLKDQLAALRWVQQNIQQFGGDKNSVTIFGESAGGASVSLLLLSPQSKGLFHRGISQSGCALCPWAYSSPARHRYYTEKLATLIGCPHKSSQALLDCFKSVSAEKIVSQVHRFIEWDIDPVVFFNPAIEPEDVEDAVITKDPWTLTSNVPWMVGFNENEGGVKVASLTQGDVSGKFNQLNENFSSILPMSLFYEYTAKNPDEITKAIKQFYFGDTEIITSDMTSHINKLFTDGFFGAGILEAARRHSGPLFLYHFTYNSSFSLCADYFKNPIYDSGVCHFDELLYMFPMEGHAPKLNTDDPDYLMSLKMIELWTNFAQNKTPRLDNQVFWHSPNGSSRDYLQISNESLTLQQNLIDERDQFWQSLPYREKPLVPHLKSPVSDEL